MKPSETDVCPEAHSDPTEEAAPSKSSSSSTTSSTQADVVGAAEPPVGEPLGVGRVVAAGPAVADAPVGVVDEAMGVGPGVGPNVGLGLGPGVGPGVGAGVGSNPKGLGRALAPAVVGLSVGEE